MASPVKKSANVGQPGDGFALRAGNFPTEPIDNIVFLYPATPVRYRCCCARGKGRQQVDRRT